MVFGDQKEVPQASPTVAGPAVSGGCVGNRAVRAALMYVPCAGGQKKKSPKKGE